MGVVQAGMTGWTPTVSSEAKVHLASGIYHTKLPCMHAGVFTCPHDGSASFLSANTSLQAHLHLECDIAPWLFFLGTCLPFILARDGQMAFFKLFTSSPCMQIEDSVDNTIGLCKASARDLSMHVRTTVLLSARNDRDTMTLFHLLHFDQHSTRFAHFYAGARGLPASIWPGLNTATSG